MKNDEEKQAEFERVYLENQVAAQEMAWAAAALAWETRQLEIRNDEIRQELKGKE